MSGHEDEAALAAAAARAGQALAPAELAGLLRFFRLLLSWNQRINLTGARSVQALADDHLPDALALLELVPRGASVVDVGAGGGLPGVPFGLLRPDARLTLVEPRAKRAAFLRTALRDLGLAAQVSTNRAESLPDGTFDVALSRATFPPAEWIELGRRLVRPGGRVVAFLSQSGVPLPEGWAGVRRLEYVAGDKQRQAVALDVPRENVRSGNSDTS